jgi:hypothetical protein
MDIRKTLQGKPLAGIGVAIFMVLLAGVIIARQYWPEKKANLNEAYLTDDDGKTWYADSAYSVPPVDHNGKTAVFAEVYTYDGGSKQFCAYLEKYNPDAKKRLEASIAEAEKNGQPASSAALFHDPRFMQSAVMVKVPGADDSKWLSETDPAASNVMSIHSPDGSPVDEVFVY